jgi:sterol desaturase/sphingolipid hydroxylase (fatty acid hydroxylase superfamily)
MWDGTGNGWLTIVALAGFALFMMWESRQPFFPFFRAHDGHRAHHFALNMTMALLNAGVVGLVFAPLWGRAASAEFGLLHRFPLPIWAHALLAILLLDGWTYFWHRANHEMAFLWRFHRMHHSDPWMDVTTARRFHPGEILFSSILRLPLIFLLGIHLWELLAYGVLMGLVVDFHHANIALPARVDRRLRGLIVTPAMHKVHHSRIRVETNSNFTSLLSVWDRLFGTFRLRTDLAAIRIGLDGVWSHSEHQTLKGLLRTPFVSQKERS